MIISSLHIRRRSTRVCQCLRFLEETQLPAAVWSLYRIHESILDLVKIIVQFGFPDVYVYVFS